MKIVVLALIAILAIPTISLMHMPTTYATPSLITESYISDGGGATLALDDAIDPATTLPHYEPTSWQAAVYTWGPSDGSGAFWNEYLHPGDYKTELLASGANWIWKPEETTGILLPDGRTVYKVTNAEAVTGDIVKFKRMFSIPSGAVNIHGTLLIATDNAFYMYVNKGFTGAPLAQGNFYDGYNYANFRDLITGFPTEGSVELPNSPPYPWSTIYAIDITPELTTGSNTLEIVGINEYSTPSNQGTPESNPGGVIYKLTIQYEQEHYLTVKTDPLNVTTIAGEGWYPNCTYVTLVAPSPVSVAPAVQYRFDHWDVDGETASGDTVIVHMNANHTATAHYVKQYYLTVVSPYDTPSGDGWFDEGSYAYAHLLTGLVPISPGVQAVFQHWTGDATGSGLTSDQIYIDAPKTAVALWTLQYYLTVQTDPENVTSIPGENWYNNCTYVTLTAPDSIPVAEGIRYAFDYWDVDGTSQGQGTNEIIVHMNTPHTVTAHYVLQYYLTVRTDPDGLQPAPPGEGWYALSTIVKLGAPPVSYLNDILYVFTYWDVDGETVPGELIEVLMDMPHVATAHYSLPQPMHLDAEPPVLIDLTSPLDTQWLELHPSFGSEYSLNSWHDTNSNGKLDPSDYVDLWDLNQQWHVQPYVWHVDDVTVTMKITKTATGEIIYVEFEGGWPEYGHVMVEPENTYWHEAYPDFSRHYHLEKWLDNCNSKLSYCDRVILRNMQTEEQAEYHVEQVKTDLIISPTPTMITVGKTKDVFRGGCFQTIPITIKSYFANPTNFTVFASYNGTNPIGSQSTTLNPFELGHIVIKWTETSTWPKGTYNCNITLNVYLNGTLIYNVIRQITFKITITGDVNGDGKVSIFDVALVSAAYGTYLDHPRWNPSADINCDGKVDMKDVAIVAANFGKVDP